MESSRGFCEFRTSFISSLGTHDICADRFAGIDLKPIGLLNVDGGGFGREGRLERWRCHSRCRRDRPWSPDRYDALADATPPAWIRCMRTFEWCGNSGGVSPPVFPIARIDLVDDQRTFGSISQYRSHRRRCAARQRPRAHRRRPRRVLAMTDSRLERVGSRSATSIPCHRNRIFRPKLRASEAKSQPSRSESYRALECLNDSADGTRWHQRHAINTMKSRGRED